MKLYKLTLFNAKFALLALFLQTIPAHALFGEDVAVLLKLVAGQITEINTLAKILTSSESNLEALKQLNEGIEATVSHLNSLDSLLERVQGLDPSSIKSLSELNSALEETKSLASQTEQLLVLKIKLSDQAINQAAIQSETSYLMGQEMVQTGQNLTREATTASPGRASQISASASSQQMLAQGVQLQGMAHLIQLQAQQLDLSRSILDSQLKAKQSDQKNVAQFFEKSRSISRQKKRALK